MRAALVRDPIVIPIECLLCNLYLALPLDILYFFFHFPIPCCQTSQLGMPVPVARRWQHMELNDSIHVQAMCLLDQVSSSAGGCGLVRALQLAALGGLKAMYIVWSCGNALKSCRCSCPPSAYPEVGQADPYTCKRKR